MMGPTATSTIPLLSLPFLFMSVLPLAGLQSSRTSSHIRHLPDHRLSAPCRYASYAFHLSYHNCPAFVRLVDRLFVSFRNLVVAVGKLNLDVTSESRRQRRPRKETNKANEYRMVNNEDRATER